MRNPLFFYIYTPIITLFGFILSLVLARNSAHLLFIVLSGTILSAIIGLSLSTVLYCLNKKFPSSKEENSNE